MLTRRASWLTTGVAVAAVAGVVAAVAGLWIGIGNTQISAAGWVAMALGVLLTLALGIGLMSLVFISSRRGYDEAGGDHVDRRQ
jgi:ABC-type multidrug transport system permease subunit